MPTPCRLTDIPIGAHYYYARMSEEIREKIGHDVGKIIVAAPGRGEDRPIGRVLNGKEQNPEDACYCIVDKVMDTPKLYRDPDATTFVLAYLPDDGRWIDVGNCKENEWDKIKQHVEEYKRAYPNIKVIITHITHTIDMQVNINPVVSVSNAFRID